MVEWLRFVDKSPEVGQRIMVRGWQLGPLSDYDDTTFTPPDGSFFTVKNESHQRQLASGNVWQEWQSFTEDGGVRPKREGEHG